MTAVARTKLMVVDVISSPERLLKPFVQRGGFTASQSKVLARGANPAQSQQGVLQRGHADQEALHSDLLIVADGVGATLEGRRAAAG